MAAFEYQALNGQGREEKGVLEADSVRQVRQLLREKGLTPLGVNPTRQKEGGKKAGVLTNLFKPSLSVNERALITRQLATLIGAALPVEEALMAVSRQSEKPSTQSMMLTVRSKVMEGFSLANSLGEYPRAFPSLHRATVAAGESAGHLDLVLNRLADFTESQQESAAKITQALIYPVILLVLTVFILSGLLGYVVPDIVKVFADSEQELPMLTTVVISASDFVVDYGLVVFVFIIAVIAGVQRLLKVPSIRLSWDRQVLALPIFGKLSRGTNTAQFASTLSILSSSGVPLVDALRIAGEVLSNTWLRKQVIEATVKVSEGSSLSSALERSGQFPPMMLHMIASGESSGELDDMLFRVAKHQQQDADLLMSILLSLFGPMMLIVLGGAVFVIVMAILMPIISLNQLVV
ncbi:MAG: type II secretion system inner membrane protein GspF [Gammaproteobacteria bacterium]|nr:type II secretion system inner membrane protein GspF [Gammaproteobacteria bacterium]MBT7372031.1 type II secretion system inner membrane protein GspF [Gammaproteobacteria bacterium]